MPKNALATATNDDALTPAEITAQGEHFYGQLQKKLERKYQNKCIEINVLTGEYVIADTFYEVARKFEAKFGLVPSWNTKIGDATRVSFAFGQDHAPR